MASGAGGGGTGRATMTLRELTSRHADRVIAAALAALYCAEIATESRFAGDRAVASPPPWPSAPRWPGAPRSARRPRAGRRHHRALEPRRARAGRDGAPSSSASWSRSTRPGATRAGARSSPARARRRGDPVGGDRARRPVALRTSPSSSVLFGGPVRRRALRAPPRRARARARGRARRARAARPSPRSARGSRASCTTSSRTRQRHRRAGARRAPHARPTTPARRASALDAIEHAGEQALAEMRRLLGLLRDGRADELSLAPQPGLRRLDELVAEHARARACRSRSSIEGEPVDAAAGRRPVGLPDRAGGADQRAQARRARATRA